MAQAETLLQTLIWARTALLSHGEGPREIPIGPSPERRWALLDELDHTILGRRLTFSTEDGVKATIEAGRGRLLKVTSVAPETLWSSDLPKFTKRQKDQTEAQVAALAGFLAALADTDAVLQVTSTPLSAHGIDEKAGYAVDELRQSVLGLPAAKQKGKKKKSGSDKLSAFLELADSMVQGTALVDADGHVKILKDDPDLDFADRATKFAAALEKQPSFVDQVVTGGKLVLLGADESAPCGVAYGSDGDRVAIVTFAPFDQADILTAWRSA